LRNLEKLFHLIYNGKWDFEIGNTMLHSNCWSTPAELSKISKRQPPWKTKEYDLNYCKLAKPSFLDLLYKNSRVQNNLNFKKNGDQPQNNRIGILLVNPGSLSLALLSPSQCNTNIFDYSNIRILSGQYFVFENEYLFSFVRIYLIFVFGQIDLTNIYSVHIRYGFGGYSAYIRYIFEYQAPNIHYSNTNIIFHWNEYIRYSYSVKIEVMNIFIFIFGSEFDIRVTLAPA
jgi:hypothetical protein